MSSFERTRQPLPRTARHAAILAGAALWVLAPSAAFAAAPGPGSAPVYWVNDPGDAMDAAPGDGVCWTGAALLPGTGRMPCTLRAAITESNADMVPSSVAFEICPTDIAPNPNGSYTIAVGVLPLPALLDPAAPGKTYVNGYTQGFPQVTPGYDDPMVAALPMPAIACNGGAGVPPRPAAPNAALFSMPLSTVISIIVDGTACAPVPPIASVITPVPGGFVPSGSIPLWAAPTGGCSGLTLLDQHNVIAGLNLRNWENAGILMFPDPSGANPNPPYQNVVWGNYIGTDEDGIGPMGNRFGVEIVGGSTGNYVGETGAIPTFGVPDAAWAEEPTPAERNLLSGNDNHPVPDVFHTYGSKCDQGPPPMSGIPFHDDGAGVFLGVDSCMRVSDSKFDDIVLGGAIDNQVRNNYIGTDFSGSFAIPNSNGVWLNFDAGRGFGFREPAGPAFYPGNHIGGCVRFPFAPGTHPTCVPQTDLDQDPNLLSGNARRINMPMRPDHDGGHGVWINGAPDPYFAPSGLSAVFNEIGGNFIGTDAMGMAKLPNTGDGVMVVTLPGSIPTVGFNEIGATSEYVPGFGSGFFAAPLFDPLGPFGFAYGNLISGNGLLADTHPVYGTFDHGVEIAGTANGDNRVAYGNVIGLDSAAAMGLGNGRNGVTVRLATTDNLIHNNSGPTISSPFTVDDVASSFGAISGNGDFAIPTDMHGVSIVDTGTTGNHVFRNCIGGDGDDCSEDMLGNAGVGVHLVGGIGNHVGQSASGSAAQGNEIHHNGEDGVRVEGAGTDGNAIRFNSIWRNGDPGGVPVLGNVGIDLNDDGDTANDVGDVDTGPNEEQNHPSTISSADGSVTFTSCAGCTVDFYGQDPVDSDIPTNRGEGRIWIKSATGTGAAQTVSLDTEIALLFGPTPVPCVTLTATDAADNTSEFSDCVTFMARAAPTTPLAARLLLMALVASLGGGMLWRRAAAKA